MDWFNSILDVAKGAGKWMESNPTAANILGGAIAGGASYYTQKEVLKANRESEERIYERNLRDKQKNSMASSGTKSYGNHYSNFSGGSGLLTSGLLTK
jgi:hypothetical protein